MSRTPRTPVYFPRMKVRGKRNRAKLAARYVARHHLPHVTLGFDPATGAATFHAAVPDKATHSIILETGPTRDGYGRIVYDRLPPKPKPKQKPKPPAPTWGMSFEMSGGLSDDVWDLLTGKAAP